MRRLARGLRGLRTRGRRAGRGLIDPGLAGKDERQRPQTAQAAYDSNDSTVQVVVGGVRFLEEGTILQARAGRCFWVLHALKCLFRVNGLGMLLSRISRALGMSNGTCGAVGGRATQVQFRRASLKQQGQKVLSLRRRYVGRNNWRLARRHALLR